MTEHQHERWQLRPSAKGGVYCAACGDHVDAPTTVLNQVLANVKGNV